MDVLGARRQVVPAVARRVEAGHRTFRLDLSREGQAERASCGARSSSRYAPLDAPEIGLKYRGGRYSSGMSAGLGTLQLMRRGGYGLRPSGSRDAYPHP
jgi:hypothetical protein